MGGGGVTNRSRSERRKLEKQNKKKQKEEKANAPQNRGRAEAVTTPPQQQVEILEKTARYNVAIYLMLLFCFVSPLDAFKL